MENKKWTDADLRTAFEDGCKFLHFKDLKDFLLERRQNVDTSERQLNKLLEKQKQACANEFIHAEMTMEQAKRRVLNTPIVSF